MHFRSYLPFALLCLASLHAAATEPRVPIEAFVEKQQFSQPRLSPDGKLLAVNVRVKRGDRVVPTMTIYRLPEKEIVSTIALPGYEIPLNFGWLTNRRLVVAKGLEIGLRERPVATGEVVAVDLDGSKSQYLYGYKAFKQSSRGDRYGDDYGYGSIVHLPRSRDGHVLVGAYEWDSKRSMLYDINTASSARKLLADIPVRGLDFVVQNDGKPRFAHGYDEENEPVLFRQDDASGQWKRIEPKKPGARFIPFAFARDDSAVYAQYSEQGKQYQIVKEDMRTGERTVVASDNLGDIQTIEYSSAPETPFAFAAATGIPKSRYLDDASADATLHKTLSAQFPDAYLHFINFTDDGQKLLFSANSDRDPGSYYLFDRKTGKAELLLTNMPDIDPIDMGERQAVQFTARDGTTIAGYLTLPNKRGAGKLPLVLFPHGGPFEEFDDWFFDTDAQFLANRGYAVLQVNFRGSGGRGPLFTEAGYRQWGGTIIDDLADGATWAMSRPDIDGSRMCVYGASFGAYAAMMLAVREPSLFKCAVGYAGRYDLPSKYKEDHIIGEKASINYLAKTMGKDQATLEAISPTRLADRIKVPVLLVHGVKDKTTSIGQAEMMRDALTAAGRPPEWMAVANEGHGFYDSENQKQFYLKLEAFLARHIGK